MRYIEIIAEVPAVDVERAADILRDVTDAGVWIETPFSQEDLESDATLITGANVLVHAFVPGDADRGGTVLTVRERFDALAVTADLEAKLVADEDWAEAWKEHFHIERYGERIVVVPSWRTYDAKPGEAVLTLDPGMAFGTGQHETTRMSLEALERTIRPGARVLDVGCGSGILSIAAMKLGANDVYAVDLDPICIDVTTANAANNSTGVRVAVGSLGEAWPFDEHAAGFDVVVANIIAGALIGMANELASALVPQGRLIASGIIEVREQEVVQAFQDAGLRVDDVRTMREWRCIEAVPA